jgi:transcriptional regulator with XRE-family HTH domain
VHTAIERDACEEAELVREVLEPDKRRCQLIGVRRFAKRAGVDVANLANVLSERRRPNRAMLAKLQAALAQNLWLLTSSIRTISFSMDVTVISSYGPYNVVVSA